MMTSGYTKMAGMILINIMTRKMMRFDEAIESDQGYCEEGGLLKFSITYF